MLRYSGGAGLFATQWPVCCLREFKAVGKKRGEGNAAVSDKGFSFSHLTLEFASGQIVNRNEC